ITCCRKFPAIASSRSTRSPPWWRSAPRPSARSRPVRCSTFPAAGPPIDADAAFPRSFRTPLSARSRAMTDPPHEQRRQRLIGIALMLATVLAFSCLDAMAKYLGNRMPTLQVVGVRCAAAFLIALMVSNPLTRPGLLKTTRPGLQLWRASMLLGSTVFNFMAFRYLQLDE